MSLVLAADYRVPDFDHWWAAIAGDVARLPDLGTCRPPAVPRRAPWGWRGCRSPRPPPARAGVVSLGETPPARRGEGGPPPPAPAPSSRAGGGGGASPPLFVGRLVQTIKLPV